MIQETVERIRKMERYFDALQNPEAEDPDTLRKMLQSLQHYYESGQWLQDYEQDEKGLLPKDLKRGVLSQDAVYDFLESLKNTAPKEDI